MFSFCYIGWGKGRGTVHRTALKGATLLAALAAMALASPSATWGQTKDTYQTSGTAAPARTNYPSQDQTQQSPSPQSLPTNKPPQESGVKIDPVQAAKTIIDIFGKKKKPRPQVEPQPESVPIPQAAEPAAPPTAKVTATRLPSERPATMAMPPVNREPTKPVFTQPEKATVTSPILKVPVQQTSTAEVLPSSPTPETLPSSDVEPVNSAAPAGIAPAQGGQDPDEATTSLEGNILDWRWIAALSAMAALIALAAKWFFFPSARIDLAFETGESRIIKTASPFASLPEATLELDFDWGMPSIPSFRFAPTGDQK